MFQTDIVEPHGGPHGRVGGYYVGRVRCSRVSILVHLTTFIGGLGRFVALTVKGLDQMLCLQGTTDACDQAGLGTALKNAFFLAYSSSRMTLVGVNKRNK